MARLMRQVDYKFKADWDQLPKAKIIEQQDFSAKLLAAWSDDSPSLWKVSDTETEKECKSILVALCKAEKVAYITFDDGVVAAAGLELKQTNGNTKVPAIDLSGMHFEIAGFSARKVCDLIFAIIQRGFATGLFKESEKNAILLDSYAKVLKVQLSTVAATTEEVHSHAGTAQPVTISISEPAVNDPGTAPVARSPGQAPASADTAPKPPEEAAPSVSQ